MEALRARTHRVYALRTAPFDDLGQATIARSRIRSGLTQGGGSGAIGIHYSEQLQPFLRLVVAWPCDQQPGDLLAQFSRKPKISSKGKAWGVTWTYAIATIEQLNRSTVHHALAQALPFFEPKIAAKFEAPPGMHFLDTFGELLRSGEGVARAEATISAAWFTQHAKSKTTAAQGEGGHVVHAFDPNYINTDCPMCSVLREQLREVTGQVSKERVFGNLPRMLLRPLTNSRGAPRKTGPSEWDEAAQVYDAKKRAR